MPSSLAVIVMAKFPEPGRVKTRLQGALSAEQAAEVHGLFLVHTIHRLRAMDFGRLFIFYDPPVAEEPMRRLVGWTDADGLMPQAPGDLGTRLAAAAGHLAHRFGGLLFLGVDSPDVPGGHLAAAAELAGSADVSIGPTSDGGYWSLGLNARVDAATLLSAIEWSSGREAAQTIGRAEALGYTTQSGPPWDDVDRPDDLYRLMERLSQAQGDGRRLLEELERVVPACREGSGVCHVR